MICPSQKAGPTHKPILTIKAAVALQFLQMRINSQKYMARTTMSSPVPSQTPDDKPESAALMIFGFLEEDSDDYSSGSGSSYGSGSMELDIDDREDENPTNLEENKAFWESQGQLLQETLRRTSSIESRIRKATKEALKELNLAGVSCGCRKPVADGCRSCTQREVSDRLRSAGYNCAICKSKWMTSKDIPSGKHTYIEVLHTSNSKKGETRVVIELTFRGEFEMPRAGDEYIKLTNRLPEVFVGKIERLNAVIKLLCSASKRCMKERKMHIAPWRKHKYMQAKWLGTREMRVPPPALAERLEQPLSRRSASMLTFDLVGNFQGLPSLAIKVV